MIFALLWASSLALEHLILAPSEFHPTQLFKSPSGARPSLKKRAVHGGHWIFGHAGNRVFSAYYHENVSHCASVRIGKKGQATPHPDIWAPAGYWAVVWEDGVDIVGSKAFCKVKAHLLKTSNKIVQQELDGFLTQLENTNSAVNGRIINRTWVEHGKWVHGRIGDKAFSAFWHPHRRHAAAIHTSKGLVPIKETWVPAGQWAFANTTLKAGEKADALYAFYPGEQNTVKQWDVGMQYAESSFVASDFLDSLERQLGHKFADRNITRRLVDGGVWLHGTADDVVFSAYYNEKKWHRVAVKGGDKRQRYPVGGQWVPPGQWAVVYSPIIDPQGIKAMYEVKGMMPQVREFPAR